MFGARVKAVLIRSVGLVVRMEMRLKVRSAVAGSPVQCGMERCKCMVSFYSLRELRTSFLPVGFC